MGFIVGLLGFISLMFGAICFVAAAVPSFGKRSSPVAPMVFGAILLLAGASLLVYAGSWL